MSNPLLKQFALPAHWSVFDSVLAELDDGIPPIDTVAFMERVGPAYLRYADATTAFSFRVTTRRKHSKTHVDHLVLPKGIGRQGTYEYRVASIGPDGSIEINDFRRVMDDRKLIGNKKVPPISGTPDRFARMFARGTGWLTSRLRDHTTAIEDMRFLDTTDTSDFVDLTYARARAADEMLDALDDILGQRYADMPLRQYLRGLLVAAMATEDAAKAVAAKHLIHETAARLDADVFGLLRETPSGFTVANYNWLADAEKPAILAARKKLIATCPILLLTEERSEPNPARNAADIDAHIARIFHAPHNTGFYKGLREKAIGAENARILPRISAYLAEKPDTAPLPKTPADWSHLAGLVSTADGIAPIIQRPPLRVFTDLASIGTYDGQSSLARYFSLRSSGGAPQSIADMAALKARLVASVIVPKIAVEAQKRDLTIPVSNIFYMASGSDFVTRSNVLSMPRKLIETIDGFNASRTIMGHMYDGVPVGDLLDAALSFGTHRGSWDEHLKEKAITNRLFENAAAYSWTALPNVDMPDTSYTVMPIRNQAELLQECYETGSDMWREGRRAITEGMHFVSIRSHGTKIMGTAMLMEPREPSDDWKIERVDTADNNMRNVYLQSVVDDYLAHPDFINGVSGLKFANTRERLYGQVMARAKDADLMGLKANTARDRAAILQALRPYIKSAEDWQIDINGCYSAPKINAVTDALLREVAPHYARQPRGAKPPGPKPA